VALPWLGSVPQSYANGYAGKRDSRAAELSGEAGEPSSRPADLMQRLPVTVWRDHLLFFLPVREAIKLRAASRGLRRMVDESLQALGRIPVASVGQALTHFSQVGPRADGARLERTNGQGKVVVLREKRPVYVCACLESGYLSGSG
jgi:hypothetical protein